MSGRKERPDWAWMIDIDDSAHGLYASRREAIQAMCDYMGDGAGGGGFVVGQVTFISHEPGLEAFDTSRVLELMDGALEDHELFGALEDSPYSCPAAHIDAADADLWQALSIWAAKWVRVSETWVLSGRDPQPLEYWRQQLVGAQP